MTRPHCPAPQRAPPHQVFTGRVRPSTDSPSNVISLRLRPSSMWSLLKLSQLPLLLHATTSPARPVVRTVLKPPPSIAHTYMDCSSLAGPDPFRYCASAPSAIPERVWPRETTPPIVRAIAFVILQGLFPPIIARS